MQRSIIGCGALADVPGLLAGGFGRRIALFAGQHSYVPSGAAATLAAQLRVFHVVTISGFGENARAGDIVRAAEDIRTARPDAILAVGGGTVLDVAKCANAVAAQSAAPLDIIEGRVIIENPGLPLVAVPTTAGSGSEATHFAVVYVGARKYSVAHPSMLPTFAVVDPELTASTPKAVAAATGLDALAHGIESYWATTASEASQRLAAEAIRLAVANLNTILTAPSAQAREAMSRAAHVAGQAINLTKTTAAHALSYALTARFGVRHGHAVALLLGQVLRHNSLVTDADVVDRRGASAVRDRVAEILSLCGMSRVDEVACFLRDLLNTGGLATSLNETGIGAEHLASIAAAVNIERLTNNPRRCTSANLLSMLHAAWAQRDGNGDVSRTDATFTDSLSGLCH